MDYTKEVGQLINEIKMLMVTYDEKIKMLMTMLGCEPDENDNVVNALADLMLLSAVKLIIASAGTTMEIKDDVLTTANKMLGGDTFKCAHIDHNEKVLTLTDMDNGLIFYKYEYGENNRLIITPYVDDGNDSDEDEDEDNPDDLCSEMLFSLRYIISICVRNQWRRYKGAKMMDDFHHFNMKEINTINQIWGTTNDSDFVIDGGYVALDEKEDIDKDFVDSGMIRLYGGQCNPKWAFGVRENGTFRIWWC